MYRYKNRTPKHMRPQAWQASPAKRLAAGAMSTVLGISMSIPFGATAALADEVNGQPTEPDSYAQEGKIKKVALQTYIVTPYNVDIMGDLIDELENNGLYF